MHNEFPSEGEASESDSDSSNDGPESSQDSGESLISENRFGPVFNYLGSKPNRVLILPQCTNNNATNSKANFLHIAEPDNSWDMDGYDEVVLSQKSQDKYQIRRLEQEFADSSRKMEQKIDKLTDALIVVQGLIQKGCKPTEKRNSVRSKSLDGTVNALSETTIYQNALQEITQPTVTGQPTLPNSQTSPSKHFSSSSEEGGQIDTSDKLININDSLLHISAAIPTEGRNSQIHDPQPSTSGARKGYSQPTPQLAMVPLTLTRVEVMIRDSELAKARMLATPGKN